MAADDSCSARRERLNKDAPFIQLHGIPPASSSCDDLDSKNLDAEDDYISHRTSSCAIRSFLRSHTETLYSRSDLYDVSGYTAGYLDRRILSAPLESDSLSHGDSDSESHKRLENEYDSDWLQLRLCLSSSVCRDKVLMHDSSPPRILELLPQRPDCGLSNLKEGYTDLRISDDEQSKRNRTLSHVYETINMERVKNVVCNVNAGRSNRDIDMYHKLLGTSCHTRLHHSGNITATGESTSQDIPWSTNHESFLAKDSELSSEDTVSTQTHHSQGIQQVSIQGDILCQDPDPTTNMVSNRTWTLPLERLLRSAQTSFKSIISSPINEDFVKLRSFVPSSSEMDNMQLNWEATGQSPSLPFSCPILQQKQTVAASRTSFRDLITSSFARESSMTHGQKTAAKSTPPITMATEWFNEKALNHSFQGQQPRTEIQFSQNNGATIDFKHASSVTDQEIIADDRNNIEVSAKCRIESFSPWLSNQLSRAQVHHVNQIRNGGGHEYGCKDSIDAGSAGSMAHARLQMIKGQDFSCRPGSAGFWFALQPANTLELNTRSGKETREPQLKRSYVRLKNGNVPLSIVRKFLISKLRLPQGSQFDFSCRGKYLDQTWSLTIIRNDIWMHESFPQLHRVLNFRSQTAFNSLDKDIMTIKYEILTRTQGR
ncbi:hypothetical protein KP509_03G013800 [Ceratopteris richardii]|nr:hypothetical protein KP509_03G013800 [Ceratopteris richardii]